MREDEEKPAAKAKHAIGEALDTFSIEELRRRVDLLRDEMVRLDAEIEAKQRTRAAADAVFRR